MPKQGRRQGRRGPVLDRQGRGHDPGGRETHRHRRRRKAVLRVDDWNEKRPLLVLSADRTLGGLVGVSKADDGKEATVALGPTIRLKGKLECKELNFKPEWVNTTVTPDGFQPYFAQNISKSAAFEFVLPAGKYKLWSYGTDVEDARRTVSLTADQHECDLRRST